MSILRTIWALLTLKAWRDARQGKLRRERYEFLKKAISERHFSGYAGLIVDFPAFNAKFDTRDVHCFRPPMYQVVKNADMKWCIFWDRARMTREIGTGAPLKGGEVILPDTIGRTKPSSTPETIDEQKTLTQMMKEPHCGDRVPLVPAALQETHQKEPDDGEDDDL